MSNKKISNTINFAYIYKQCKRKNILGDLDELSIFLNEEYEIVTTDVTIGRFSKIKGYKVVYGNSTAFFPNENELKPSGGLSLIRDKLEKYGVIIPQFVGMEDIEKLISLLEEKEKKDDVIIDFFRRHLSIPELLVSLYVKNDYISKYIFDIFEAVKSHFLGLNKMAVVGLIPCVEGILREIGYKNFGVKSDVVSKRQLLEGLSSFETEYIKKYVFGDFDWYPSGTFRLEYFKGRDELIDCVESLRSYIDNVLYKNTKGLVDLNSLNRHAIVHGFNSMSSYEHPSNFFRLINIINSLVILTGYIDQRVSSFHPISTEESKKVSVYLHSLNVLRNTDEKMYSSLEIDHIFNHFLTSNSN